MVLRGIAVPSLLTVLGLAAACSGSRAGTAPPNLTSCAEFVEPARPDTSRCDDPVTDPRALAPCELGSGDAGRWTLDPRGLPAYDFALEERCDTSATAYSPRPYPLRDPMHMIGNGRGLVALAHASGGIEIYTQDRGHAWVNHVDHGSGDALPEFAEQLGGGFSYVVSGSSVRSTRFEDLSIDDATATQTRRFGVGYFETVTTFPDVVVRRVIYAPDANARALVAEVTLENRGSRARSYGVVESWDPDHHQLPVAFVTSDLLTDVVTLELDQSRRALGAKFTQTLSWDASAGIARVSSVADVLPPGVDDPTDPSDVDWFPPSVYLATLDAGVAPDAVWLADDEVFETFDRHTPVSVATPPPGYEASRTRTLSGDGQHGFLAMRIPVTIPAHGSVTRRFAFGYVPRGTTDVAAVDELRTSAAATLEGSLEGWRDRVIYASFPGLPDAGAIQRELAWSSYMMQANVTYDEHTARRVSGQGGSYKYIHGMDGAMGDYCVLADSLLFVDPAITRDTLAYAMAQQRASSDATPNRYPYATTGVNSFSDVGLYTQRSDAYWLIPTSVARYVGLTRDASLLDEVVPYAPPAANESGTVVQHLNRGFDYTDGPLGGTAARGLVAIGTNDYADGLVLEAGTSGQTSTPTGTSSTFNSALIVMGLPLAADVVDTRDAALATRMRAYVTGQTTALAEANVVDPVNGWVARGFVDNGDPLLPQHLYIEPQVLSILAGTVSTTKRDELLDLIADRMETPFGAMTTIDLSGGGGGVGSPQVSGVWPVVNAWVTQAYAKRSASEAWDSFTRNTLFRHATIYPHLWYGIWSGPDSYYGPDNSRPGEADAHLATALTDFPVFNAHVHAGPIRALMGLLGVSASVDGITVDPTFPTETYAVEFPRLSVTSTPTRFEVRATFAASGPVVFRLRGGVALRSGSVSASVDGGNAASTRVGESVHVTANAVAGTPIVVAIATP